MHVGKALYKVHASPIQLSAFCPGRGPALMGAWETNASIFLWTAFLSLPQGTPLTVLGAQFLLFAGGRLLVATVVIDGAFKVVC